MTRLPALGVCVWGACVLALAACGVGADGAPARTGANPIGPIYTQGAPPRAAKPVPPRQAQEQPPPQQPGAKPPPRRRSGGSIPEPYGSSPTAPPPIMTPPGPDTTTDTTARFKQDLLSPGVQDLQTRDALKQLDPIQQRELLMKQQELHQLQTDPLRR